MSNRSSRHLGSRLGGTSRSTSSPVQFDALEPRRHLSGTVSAGETVLRAPRGPVVPGAPEAVEVILSASSKAPLAPAARAVVASEGNMTAAQVSQILAQAASQARPGQAVAVVDREGIVLGVFATTGASQASIDAAVVRARTGAYFQSTQNAFTTRTARFIIQDRFPFPIRNTAGGPLYGVEFSNLPGSDMLTAAQVPGISGDPGGLPLFLNRVPVGGIGVAGDGSDVAARFEFAAPGQKVFDGNEESDFDESVALAGVSGGGATIEQGRIVAAAPKSIVATQVFLPGPALRFPYTGSPVARGQAFQTLAQLVTAGRGTIVVAPTNSLPNPYPKVAASVYGVAGELKNTSTLNNDPGFGVIASDDTEAVKLTTDDVNTIIRNAVKTSVKVRAAIRLPIGVRARVHIAVVDRDGTVLGVFREEDGTNFSFDVAVQKARTAAFFSSDEAAFSTRAIGFMSQQLFPAGIDDGGVTGPMFHLQNALSLNPGNLGQGPLANGITIFPGGVPLYKDGVLVGGIGISGDGVEQDDQIAFGGTKGFAPRREIRVDRLSKRQVVNAIVSKVERIQAIYNVANADPKIGPVNGATFAEQARESLNKKLDFRLPYVKFARNPLI